MNDIQLSAEAASMPVLADRYVASTCRDFAERRNAGVHGARNTRPMVAHGTAIWMKARSGSRRWASQYSLLHRDFKSMWRCGARWKPRVLMAIKAAPKTLGKPLRGRGQAVTAFKDGAAVALDFPTTQDHRVRAGWHRKLSGQRQGRADEMCDAAAECAEVTTHAEQRSEPDALPTDAISGSRHGRFRAGARKPGSRRVTRTTGNENEIAWSPDSRKMAMSAIGRQVQIYFYSSRTLQTRSATARGGYGAVSAPMAYSAFVRDRQGLRVTHTPSKRALLRTTFSWSPSVEPFYHWVADSKCCVFQQAIAVRNLWPRGSGGEPRQISFLSNTNAVVLLGADGTYILFDTTSRTETKDRGITWC